MILTRKVVFLQIYPIFTTSDSIEGQSHFWHELSSYPYAKVLGYVGCKTTSKYQGIGFAEQLWSNVKLIKDDKSSNLGGTSLEKLAIFDSSVRLNEAQIKHTHD